MMHGRLARTSVVSLVIGLLLTAAPTWAQSSASGIAGIVKDTSGAVLPGVTVEAASPALIEKVRTVVSDGQGRYNVTELRPGTYTVTFSLPGFGTVKREGVALVSGFTATINADMQVGSVAETITVTGESPQVDVQNVRQQTVVARTVIESLPVGQGSTSAFVALIPGLGDGGMVDIGGTGGAWQAGRATYGTYHGKIGLRTTMDGMRTQNTGTGKAPGYTINQFFVEEVAVETGGITAEGSASAMAMNHIPKEGSNQLRFTFESRYMAKSMQADNVGDLSLRGVTSPQQLQNLYDVGLYVGGPILRDRVWFYSGVRRWGFRRQIPGLFENATVGTNFYTADPSRPVFFTELDQSYGGRLTWQASKTNKVAFFTDYGNLFSSHGSGGGSPGTAPEAQNRSQLKPSGITQGSWTSTRSSKFLLEAGAGQMFWHNFSMLQPGVPLDRISILETLKSFRYNAPNSYYNNDDPWKVDRFVQRFSASYVTGSHSFKTGVQVEEGVIKDGTRRVPGPSGGALSYRFTNGKPTGLDYSAAPYVQQATMWPDLGLFAQDQWRVSRFALNLGLRFDLWKGFVPAQTLPATRFVPERHYDRLGNQPDYKDISPRLGVAYDIFGNGRTALKLSVGRYNDLSGLFYTQVVDPVQTAILTARRSWTDNNLNFIPDCDLNNLGAQSPTTTGSIDTCGKIDNDNFGKANPNAVRFDDSVTKGWFNRPYTMDIATEVQHQITRGLSVTGGYYHNWDGNIRALVNTAVTPADFDPYCITTPVNPLLPGGGGQKECGLYNISEAKFSSSSLVWKKSTDLDPRGIGSTRVSNFVSSTVDLRLRGIRVGGGVDTGRTVWDTCFTVENPQQTTIIYITAGVGQRAVEQRYCHEVQGLMANLQVKLNGSAPLPGGVTMSLTYQNLAGQEIRADYTATSTDVAQTLNRPLSGQAANVVIPIIRSYSQYEPRRTQLDLRLGKNFRAGGNRRVQANVDLYNIFNSNSVLSRTDTYGPSWNAATSFLPGRMAQLGAILTF